MADWFDFAGVRSTALGVYVQDYPDATLPEERADFKPVLGRSGSLTLLEGDAVYDDVVLSVNCFMRDLETLDQVAAWLRGAGNLVLGNMPNRYYVARCVNQIELKKIMRGRLYRSFTAVFRCDPYRYAYPAIPSYSVSVTVKTVAVQAGSGTPSPSNIRAISGKATVTPTVNAVGTVLTPSATLYGLTAYEDEIGSDGHETHKTALLSLAGTESWVVASTQPTLTTLERFQLTISGMALTTPAGVCSHFPYQSVPNAAYTVETATGHPNGDSVSIYILKSRMSGWSDAWSDAQKVTAFKAWLAAQVTAGTPVKVLYQRATPTTTTGTAIAIYSITNTATVTSDGSSVAATFTGLTYIALTSGGTINNPGTAEAIPLITIVGSGNIDLTIGTRTIHIASLASAITIDCDTGMAYNGVTDLTSTVSLDYYPWTIVPGASAVSWTGTVTSVAIAPNWRYL